MEIWESVFSHLQTAYKSCPQDEASSLMGSVFYYRFSYFLQFQRVAFSLTLSPKLSELHFCSFSCAVMISNGISHLFRAYYTSEVTLGILCV